jgi:hypothetical protein
MTGWRKPLYSKKRLPQLQFVHHKFYMECPWTELGPQLLEPDVLPELRPYHFSLHFVKYTQPQCDLFQVMKFLCDEPYLRNGRSDLSFMHSGYIGLTWAKLNFPYNFWYRFSLNIWCRSVLSNVFIYWGASD